MRIRSVSYGFTKNLGNFQSQRVDCSVELQEDEDPDTALELAVAFVEEALDHEIDSRQESILEGMRTRVMSLDS